MTKQTKNNPYLDIQNEYDNALIRKYNKWMIGTSETPDQPAFTSYVNKLIDQKGGGSGPAPTPSGSVSNIQITTSNERIGDNIEGRYAVNIIDYRELSQDNTIGVGGITSAKDPRQRLLYTHGKKILGNSAHYAGYKKGPKSGFTGIKKGKDIHLDFHWMKKPESGSPRPQTGEIDLTVFYDGQAHQGHNKQIKYNSDQKGSQTISDIEDYGYYRIGLGSASSANPEEYSIHYQAFYTDEPSFKPQGLTRDFHFKKFNNIELMSNGGTEKDIYTRGKLFDTLTKKVNCVNVKDLKIHYGINIPDQPSLHANFLAIEMPEDAEIPLVPDHSQEQKEKDIGAKTLTNNLSEVPNEDHALHQDTEIPYFVSKIENMIFFDENGKSYHKYCWIIIINQDHVYKWQDLIAKTQIIYPIKEKYKTPIHLPLGGQLYTLTNNRTIMTCLYSKVEENKSGTGTGTVTFSGSPFGANDVTIQKSEIVSIEQI